MINTHDIESIFSVCLRFYTHRIALKLNKETGVKWYQFWVDPFSNRNNCNIIWKIGAQKVERKLLSAASTVFALPEVFSNSEIIHDYKHKLVTFEIPYLIDREVRTTNDDIVFAGGFLKGIRDPEPVLDLLVSVCNQIRSGIKFHFYIKGKEKYEDYHKKSQGKICFFDYVGHEELYSILGSSYMLLNIGNAGSIQMPSKTVEYVSFRKPLLFFYKDGQDPSLRYLDEYPDICRINVEDDFEENVQKINCFLNRSHENIQYDDLLKTKCYFESTPDYIKNQLLTS